MKDQQDEKMYAYTTWMSKHGGFAKDMTMRDYFAAKAMEGLLSSTKTANQKVIAEDAYKMADQMLEARET